MNWREAELKLTSYVVLLPSHCLAEPNVFNCSSSEYNRLNFVRHGSSTTYELGLKNNFRIQRHNI